MSAVRLTQEALARQLHTAVAEGRINQERAEQIMGRYALHLAERDALTRELAELGIAVDGPAPGTPIPREPPASPTPASDARDLDAVITQIRAELGDPATWESATEYDSLALGIIDSVWSIGVRYQGVVNVVERYRALRRQAGHDAERDTPGDLAAAIEDLGAPEAFAGAVANRQRTSATSGILKAEAVLLQARVLVRHGIETREDLRSASDDKLQAVRADWIAVTGQGSGLSWDYFLMLAGMPGVKADRMVRRFVARALGLADVSAERGGALILAAAEQLGARSQDLDYTLWRGESGQ